MVEWLNCCFLVIRHPAFIIPHFPRIGNNASLTVLNLRSSHRKHPITALCHSRLKRMIRLL